MSLAFDDMKSSGTCVHLHRRSLCPYCPVDEDVEIPTCEACGEDVDGVDGICLSIHCPARDEEEHRELLDVTWPEGVAGPQWDCYPRDKQWVVSVPAGQGETTEYVADQEWAALKAAVEGEGLLDA